MVADQRVSPKASYWVQLRYRLRSTNDIYAARPKVECVSTHMHDLEARYHCLMAEGCRLLREGSPGDAWFLIQMELSLSLSLPVQALGRCLLYRPVET